MQPSDFTVTPTQISASAYIGYGPPQAPRPLKITHTYSAESPYLFRVDVTVQNTTTVMSGPLLYRRSLVFAIIGAADRSLTIANIPAHGSTPYLRYSSNDGWANPDPAAAHTYCGKEGFFADHQSPLGGIDDGGLFELDLGRIASLGSVTFTLYFGTGPDVQTVLNAVAASNAQVYMLFNPGGGYDPTVLPETQVFAIDGSGLNPAGNARAIQSVKRHDYCLWYM